MSIKIHHGPNGSYKTAGAIQDDLIPAIYEGRPIITNVRGLTRERVYEVLPDAPEGIEIHHLSMESTVDIEKMRSWFTWAPHGAFIIFDETQLIFLKAWTDKYLERFDYAGGPEKAAEDDRPINWLDAWTRHRHFNWDIVLTTPRIKYIRDDIRNTCEMAYLHSNLAVIGIKGRYKEAMHDAQENRPPMDGTTIVELKKIRPDTFKLYQSTATGDVKDTRAGKNLFLSPKVLGLLALVAALVFSIFNSGPIAVFSPELVKNAGSVSASSTAPSAGAPSRAPSAVAPGPVVAGKGAAASAGLKSQHPLSGFKLQVRASLSGLQDGKPKQIVLFDVADSQDRVFQQSSDDLRRLGYLITVKTPCVVEVRHSSWRSLVFCPGKDPEAVQGLPVASAGASASPTTAESLDARAPARPSGSVQSEGGPARGTSL